MGSRDHSCEGCGRGGLNDPDGVCECSGTEPMGEAKLALSVGQYGLLFQLRSFGDLRPGEFIVPSGWAGYQTVLANLRRLRSAGLVMRNDDGGWRITVKALRWMEAHDV